MGTAEAATARRPLGLFRAGPGSNEAPERARAQDATNFFRRFCTSQVSVN